MKYSIEKLKAMNIDELYQLAANLRNEILHTVKDTGGHLASNLGVVELTIALHFVFESPKDLFFFDVSHQSYVHKLLTGRDDVFPKLRKYNGLSGFSSKLESQHDIYEAGHSSTSISAALGYLEAKTENPELFDNAIAVIGDASIVNGLSLEAINYLGSKPNQKLIIILNDNEMGISKNVGGLAKTLNRIRVKGQLKLLRRMIPNNFKRMMKSIAYKNTLFNSMGIKYLGVIDGHNLKELIQYLEYAKKSPNSVILHIKTIKGKGYKFAEEDKTGVWHSTPPFDLESGVQKANELEPYLFGSHIANYLLEKVKMGVSNLRVITPGMSYGSGLDDFASFAPRQFIDVGIAEENAVLMASSMAQAGLKPYVFVYSTFLQRAYDEIIHDMARLNQPVVICLDRSGIVDGDGPTHQGIYDIAYMSSIPNLHILAPRDIGEVKRMLDYTEKHPNSYVIRYPKYAYCLQNISIEPDIVRWEIVKESKNQKYLITYGPNIDVFEKLSKNSSIGIINARAIRPFDQELVHTLLLKKNKLYFYEEVIQNNCLASQVLVYANELIQKKEIQNFYIQSKTLPDTYLPVGNKEELLHHYQMTIKEYIKQIEED